METIPTTFHSLDRFYHINDDTFKKQYKEILRGYRELPELFHAEEWLEFPENMGESLYIDETAPSNGDLYTIVTNHASRKGKDTIVAIIKGISAYTVIEVLMRIDQDKRLMVKEITMDMSNSIRLIVKRCFPNTIRITDRFHIQRLASDAVQEMRITTDVMQSRLRLTQRRKPNTWDIYILTLYWQTGIRRNSCLNAIITNWTNPN